jgi:ferredoxin
LPTTVSPTRQRCHKVVIGGFSRWGNVGSVTKDAASAPVELMSPETAAQEAGSLQVWIDQDLCTGDGLCVQYAPQIFEFDIDGLAYVKDASGELQLAPGARTDVPAHLRLDVIDAARDCPGECIHVVDRS